MIDSIEIKLLKRYGETEKKKERVNLVSRIKVGENLFGETLVSSLI